jgi:hypothetical protein
MERVDAAHLEAPRFRTTEEELSYLRDRVREKERELDLEGSSFERTRLARREVKHYAEAKQEEHLHDRYVMPEHDVLRTALNLEVEEHDAQVSELLRIVEERGVKNALSVAARMKNPHLEDDLHRALIRYIAEGLPIKGVSEGDESWRALSMTLYEVHPQVGDHRDAEKKLEEVLAGMEQLYAGFLAMTEGSKNGTFTMEIAMPEGEEHAIFFIAVPRSKREMFERHVRSVFPGVLLMERRGDYNIFNPDGVHTGAVAHLAAHPAVPLKDYRSFERDPMEVLLSSFSKLSKHGEGAAIQIVVGNEKDRYNKYYGKILRTVNGGTSLKDALKTPETTLGDVARDFGSAIFGGRSGGEKDRAVDTPSAERIARKTASRIVPVNVRVLASARTKERAQELLDNLTSTFNQFDDASGNSIRFEEVRGGKLTSLLRAFSFRSFVPARAMPLNTAELTAMYHLTAARVTSSRELKLSRAKEALAPIDMPQEGVVLGVNHFGGSETTVRFAPEDRLRHFYAIGQTGTGKTSLIKHMAIEDMKNGDGMCFIDPHGSDILDILASVPEHRREDVIYFDPAYTARPMGLNMLEYDPRYPEQKTFVVNELLAIFEKLYENNPEGLGPMFQQYFRNAAMLVIEDPASGSTLAEIPRVLSDSAFRKMKLSRCRNPLVVQFWTQIAEQAGGEASLENIVPYITSKTDTFLANDIMRPIVVQEHSAFNVREIMDGRKILLANLSKGRLGDTNANLLGLILVSKFLKAALSRADAPGVDLPVCHLYIDEFQNFTTPSIATILSEARKYKLSLNVAHQFLAQLRDDIRSAVFGNVGTKCVFRVGTEDAEELAKGFAPTFGPSDVEHLDNYHAYISLLVNGKPVPPFSIRTLPPRAGDSDIVDQLKERSYQRYGRPREEVEREIANRFSDASM